MEDTIGLKRRKKFIQFPEIVDPKQQWEDFIVNLRKNNRMERIESKRKDRIKSKVWDDHDLVEIESEIQRLFKLFGGTDQSDTFDYIINYFLHCNNSWDLLDIYVLFRSITANDENSKEFQQKFIEISMLQKYEEDLNEFSDIKNINQIFWFLINLTSWDLKWKFYENVLRTNLWKIILSFCSTDHKILALETLQ